MNVLLLEEENWFEEDFDDVNPPTKPNSTKKQKIVFTALVLFLGLALILSLSLSSSSHQSKNKTNNQGPAAGYSFFSPLSSLYLKQDEDQEPIFLGGDFGFVGGCPVPYMSNLYWIDIVSDCIVSSSSDCNLSDHHCHSPKFTSCFNGPLLYIEDPSSTSNETSAYDGVNATLFAFEDDLVYWIPAFSPLNETERSRVVVNVMDRESGEQKGSTTFSNISLGEYRPYKTATFKFFLEKVFNGVMYACLSVSNNSFDPQIGSLDTNTGKWNLWEYSSSVTPSDCQKEIAIDPREDSVFFLGRIPPQKNGAGIFKTNLALTKEPELIFQSYGDWEITNSVSGISNSLSIDTYSQRLFLAFPSSFQIDETNNSMETNQFNTSLVNMNYNGEDVQQVDLLQDYYFTKFGLIFEDNE